MFPVIFIHFLLSWIRVRSAHVPFEAVGQTSTIFGFDAHVAEFPSIYSHQRPTICIRLPLEEVFEIHIEHINLPIILFVNPLVPNFIVPTLFWFEIFAAYRCITTANATECIAQTRHCKSFPYVHIHGGLFIDGVQQLELWRQYMLILDWIINYGVTQTYNRCPFRVNFIRITTIHSITIAFRMNVHRNSRCMIDFLFTCNTCD